MNNIELKIFVQTRFKIGFLKYPEKKTLLFTKIREKILTAPWVVLNEKCAKKILGNFSLPKVSFTKPADLLV